MPRGPKGEKRPADVIGNAVHVMRVATGEIEEEARQDDQAVAFARSGGARAQVRAVATYRSGAYRASKGLRPFCRQSLEMTSRFSSRFSLLSAAIAPPIIFPFSVLIVARNGFMPV
jgi:hypothetical protein